MSSIGEYVQAITRGERDWVVNALCAGSGAEERRRWTCREDEIFVMASGEKITGYDVQLYLTENICRHCPVQWECARQGLEEEELEARSTGAWAMTRRDRRWFARREDALGQIDLAKMNSEPIVDMIARLRFVE